MAGKESFALTGEGRAVLRSLVQAGTPQAPKQIAQAAGLDGKLVGELIKGLRGQGLVDSPVRCKYGISDAGRDSLDG